jgi:hypothetical protein
VANDKRAWMQALTDHAAVAIGPIASIVVQQAVAAGGSFDAIRKRIAKEMDEQSRQRFFSATSALAAGAPGKQAAMGASSATPDTLDRSDPSYVRALARELAERVGPHGEAMVQDAARRCRTKMQLCIRLASAVADPQLKALLSQHALGESKPAPTGKA